MSPIHSEGKLVQQEWKDVDVSQQGDSGEVCSLLKKLKEITGLYGKRGVELLYSSSRAQFRQWCLGMHRMSWNAELDTGLEVCGVTFPVSIAQNWHGGGEQREKCFALSHIPLKEFLDIKAGVMTVKVVSFYSRNGCHAHTSRAGVYLALCVSSFAYRQCQEVVFTLQRYSWFSTSWTNGAHLRAAVVDW